MEVPYPTVPSYEILRETLFFAVKTHLTTTCQPPFVSLTMIENIELDIGAQAN